MAKFADLKILGAHTGAYNLKQGGRSAKGGCEWGREKKMHCRGSNPVVGSRKKMIRPVDQWSRVLLIILK